MRSWIRAAACVGVTQVAMMLLVAITSPAWAEPSHRHIDTSRIVSIGGDVSEILDALGLTARIVAVDTTSKHPPELLASKASVGYLRALSAEGVLAVNPSVIIASADAGPPEVVAALKASSVPYMEVPADDTWQGVSEKLRFVGRATGTLELAEPMAAQLAADFDRLAQARAGLSQKVRVLLVLAVQNGRATVGGSRTSADAMLSLAGAENAASKIQGFKPMTDEAVVEATPETIILLQRAGSESGKEELLQLKGFAATPAGQAKRIIEMDANYLLGFGPRAALAARELMEKLYPDQPAQKAEAVAPQ